MKELFRRMWTDLDVGLMIFLPFLGCLAAIFGSWASSGHMTPTVISAAVGQWVLSMAGALRGLKAEPSRTEALEVPKP